MASNLKPYNVSSHKDNHFVFVTDYGAIYECYFISYSEYFKAYPHIAPYIYAVNLDIHHPPSKNIVDRRIADTLITLINNFLSDKINAVVYICDSSDGKSASRSRKFKSWYDYANLPSNQIIQLSNNFKIYGTIYYTVMFLHRKSKFKNEFALAYFDFIDVSNEDK